MRIGRCQILNCTCNCPPSSAFSPRFSRFPDLRSIGITGTSSELASAPPSACISCACRHTGTHSRCASDHFIYLPSRISISTSPIVVSVSSPVFGPFLTSCPCCPERTKSVSCNTGMSNSPPTSWRCRKDRKHDYRVKWPNFFHIHSSRLHIFPPPRPAKMEHYC